MTEPNAEHVSLAYPNGQCPACGWGLTDEGACDNDTCSNYGQIVGEPKAEYVLAWNPNRKVRATLHRSSCPVLKRLTRGQVIPYVTGTERGDRPTCAVCKPAQIDRSENK